MAEGAKGLNVVGLLRANSGFFDDQLLSVLEQRRHHTLQPGLATIG